jgi:hypothetical protein
VRSGSPKAARTSTAAKSWTWYRASHSVRRFYGCKHGRHHPEQAARLEDTYAHRHDLIHELARYLIDPDLEPDFDLFIEALKTLRGISRVKRGWRGSITRWTGS